MNLDSAEIYAARKNAVDAAIAGHTPEEYVTTLSPWDRFFHLSEQFSSLAGVLRTLDLTHADKQIMEVSGKTPNGADIIISLTRWADPFNPGKTFATAGLQAEITCDGQKLPVETISERDIFDLDTVEMRPELNRRMRNLEETFEAVDKLVSAHREERQHALARLATPSIG